MGLLNCDHWYAACTKCGRRYHLCSGTTQCEKCRIEHYRFDRATGKRTLVFYRNTRHEGENRMQKLGAAANDVRYRGFVGKDLSDVEDELYRIRPDLKRVAP